MVTMMKKNSVILLLIIFSVVAFSGCLFNGESPGDEVKAFVENEYDVSSDAKLVISTINGEISVSSWKNDSILLNATKRSRYGEDDLDNAEILVSETDDDFSIKIQNEQPVRNRAVDLVIHVPMNLSVSSVSSTNGNVHLANTTGNTDILTTNGGIIGEYVDGYVSATSTNGFIKLLGCKGLGDLLTSNGRITAGLLGFKDGVSIQSTNGDIILHVSSVLNASIDVTTTNGEISVDENIVTISDSSDTYIGGRIGFGGNEVSVLSVNEDISITGLYEE